MGHIYEALDASKRYVRYSAKEVRWALIAIILVSFTISFRKWGLGDNVDLGFGFVNFVGAFIIVAISFAARTTLQKIFAVSAGYRADYRLWSLGILIMLIIVFLSNGRLWFVIPGTFILNYMPGHRIGFVRYGLNWFGMGVVSMAGPLANIILAMIFKALFETFKIPLFQTAFLLNIIWALWSMFPLPPADGGRMILGSRLAYMWCLGVVVFSSILLYANVNIFVSIIGSIILAWFWMEPCLDRN